MTVGGLLLAGVEISCKATVIQRWGWHRDRPVSQLDTPRPLDPCAVHGPAACVPQRSPADIPRPTTMALQAGLEPSQVGLMSS